MDWLQAAKKVIDAENHRKEKTRLVSLHGKLGFIIFYLESYISSLELMGDFPYDMVFEIIKYYVLRDAGKARYYYYFPLHGKMLDSPFGLHLDCYKGPDDPSYDRTFDYYDMFIEESCIGIDITGDLGNLGLFLDLSECPGSQIRTLEDFLEGIDSFEKFQSQLLKAWNVSIETLVKDWDFISIDLPIIFDPKPLTCDDGSLITGVSFHKMRLFWQIIYTIRGMIYLPKLIPPLWPVRERY